MPVVAWLKRLARRRLDEQDFQDEIRAHLAIAADERVDDGTDRPSAERASRKDFGNVLLTTEAARRVWTPRWLDALHDQVSDVRYAIRALAKSPVFSFTVVGVLTLGIGLNAAVFTMLKSMALSPLAGVDGSSRLAVIVGETGRGRQLRLSYPDYQYLRDHDDAFSGLFGSGLVTAGLGRGRSSRSLWAELVTGNYFQILGVPAELGRTLLPSDETAPGRDPVVVLSDGLWRRGFGADPHIVGRTVEVNHYMLAVVGVADPSFHGTIVGYDVEAFVPVTMAAQLGITGGSTHPDVVSDRRAMLLFPQGHLRQGTSLAHAAAETDALWTARARDRPLTDANVHLRVVPFWRSPTGGQTYLMPTLIVLAAMGLLVLVVACANIAGLVLARGVSRRGEIGVRLALGAPRMRIVRLLIVENLVLALPATAMGMLLAARGIPLFVRYAEALAAPQLLFFNIDLDRFVIGFAALLACGSALVFGFVPALQSSRVDLASVMCEVSPRGAARGRLRAGLVVAQVAVSLLLLVGAGLVSQSAAAARAAYPGFDPKSVAAIEMDLRQNAYDEAKGRVFYRHLLDAARADPGVESATLAEFTPMDLLGTSAQPTAVDGYEPRRGEDMAFLFNVVASDYFRTLRIPLVRGRAFEDRDDEKATPVAIVNETFADRFWGGADTAIGKRVRVGGDGDWRTVVGVAADVKYRRINEAPQPYAYLPFLQAYWPAMVLHVRGTAPIDVLVDQARAHVAALDGDLPILYAKPLTERIRGSFVFFDLTAFMLSVFGAAGMALAALGTYGLVSYTVEQSTHEIGIRMALGARGRSVVRGFLGRGLRLGVTGAALGGGAALGLGRLLRTALFGVSPTDPLSFARALGIVGGGVLVATLVPAWRAARTNPLSALRHQ